MTFLVTFYETKKKQKVPLNVFSIVSKGSKIVHPYAVCRPKAANVEIVSKCGSSQNVANCL